MIRITAIALFYAATLLISVAYIKSIGFGINNFSGIFNFTLIKQSIESFFYLAGALILMLWSLSKAYHVKEHPLITLFSHPLWPRETLWSQWGG
jgi:hypothetical protein